MAGCTMVAANTRYFSSFRENASACSCGERRPYASDFDRFRHHKSGACHGMSLRAATSLGTSKGYSLICTDLAGLNAFFVRSDRLTPRLRLTSPEAAFRPNRYRGADALSQEQQERVAFLGSVIEIN